MVIGGGAAGLVVASGAAQFGCRVTLIEKQDRLGGDCLHYGCVPSKSLLHVAKVAALLRRAPEFGLPAHAAPIDLAKVNAYVAQVIAGIQEHDDPQRFRGYGCEVLFGPAHFLDPHSVQVGGRTIRARRFVIATGSRPAVPPIEGLAEAGGLTNESLFSLSRLPRRLIVLGAGPVGIELAQACARLGSTVTVVGRASHILPQEDPELTEELRGLLFAEGLGFHTAASARRVLRVNGVCRVSLSNGQELEGDEILVATGRCPNVEDLQLEAAGVDYGARGIRVDARLRTSRRHIYACGDVCGPYAFTHMAEYQAGVVLSNAVLRLPRTVDYRLVPRVTFTDPELAHVGLTEQQARERGWAPVVLRYPFRSIDRALTAAEGIGQVKLIARRGKILGASILGPQAGELLHELVLAMRLGARLRDIATTIHAYPTLAQVHRRAVNSYYGPKLFSPAMRTLVRWLNRLLP